MDSKFGKAAVKSGVAQVSDLFDEKTGKTGTKPTAGGPSANATAAAFAKQQAAKNKK